MAKHHSQDYPFAINPSAPAEQVIVLLSLDLADASADTRDTLQGVVFELELQERLLKDAAGAA